MRKLLKSWKQLHWLIRWMIVTLIIAGSAYAYYVLTITGEVTVEEAIGIEEPTTFSVTLKPNETDIRTFTVTNTSSEAVEVMFEANVSPSGQGVTAETSPDDNLNVPGNGSAQFTLTIEAENDVVPQTYTVTVDIDR